MPRLRLSSLSGVVLGVSFGLTALLTACEEAKIQSNDPAPSPGAGGSTGGNGVTNPPAIDIPNKPAPMAGPPKACGEEKHTLERVPAEIIVMLDRSNTMRYPVGTSPNSRLVDVSVALDEVVKITEKKIFWGLRYFPPTHGCDVTDDNEVPLSLDNHVPISTSLKAAKPNTGITGTPMQRAIRKATEYFMARGTTNPKYIVLGTDGLPNCRDGHAGADDTPGTIQAIADARAAGIQTFVVGIAAGDENSPSSKGLSAMADAGGQARAMVPRFYPVNQPAELAQVLGDITARTSSCVFPLKQKPMNPEEVSIWVDGKQVPKDATNGWSWDEPGNAIVVNGDPCKNLQSSKIDINVQIVFGCAID